MAQYSHGRPDKAEVVSERAMVAAKHPLAVEAGLAMLAQGGNAMDAAVAMGFVMCAVKPMMTCLGGIGLLVAQDGTTGEAFAVEGPPRAPLAATPDMFTIEGIDTGGVGLFKTKNDENRIGHKAVAVPGNVALLCAAHARMGRLPLAAVLEPAIGICEDGFTADWFLTTHTALCMPELARNAAAAAIFLPGGFPPSFIPGDGRSRIVQRDLAATLRQIARQGPDGFYRGEVAEAIEQDFAKHGGLITREDLARYQARITAPRAIRYRDVEVLAPALPCGGTTAQETLRILERFDIARAGHNTPATLHVYIEAARRAFADRFAYLADPDVVPVPVAGLLSAGHASDMAARINRNRATSAPADAEPWVHYATATPEGDPWRWNDSPRPAAVLPGGLPDDDSCTTHLTAVDAERNAVSCTITAGELFGARVVTPGTGILWNGGMAWFNAGPGAANSIAPGKRALTNMTPVLVRRDGRVVLAAGAPGGRKIIGAVTQVVSNVVDHGMTAQAAVTAPRVDASARAVQADIRLDPATVDALRGRGHTVQVVEEIPAISQFARPVVIQVDADNRLRSGLAPHYITIAAGI